MRLENNQRGLEICGLMLSSFWWSYLPLLRTCKRIADQGRFQTWYRLNLTQSSLESLQDPFLVMPEEWAKLSINKLVHFEGSYILPRNQSCGNCCWEANYESISLILRKTLFATDEKWCWNFSIADLVGMFKLQKKLFN